MASQVNIRGSVRRWADLVCYALIGTWFGVFGGLLCARLWTFINAFWPDSTLPIGDAFAIGTSALLLVLCTKASGGRWQHFRYFWSYPPTLVSVLIAWTIGLIALATYPGRFPIGDRLPVAQLLIATIAVWLTAGVLVPFILRLRPKRTNTAVGKSKTKDDLHRLTLEELVVWLGDERPIANRSDDYFGANDRALQVWKAIKTRRSGPFSTSLMQTVVIEGPFGSGKTSVIELLERHIADEQPERFVVCRVSAWGFSSSAARQFILDQAIEALRRRVDCLSVRGLPKDYTDVLSKSVKWLPAILYPWTDDSTPVQKLQSLTPILRAIDTNLIVVVEDSDRSGSDFEPEHLQAMLNDFRQVERLSFILTVGSTARIDFPKLAEQIITIAHLQPSDVGLLLDRIRDHCRHSWPVIDTVTDSQNRPTSLSEHIEAAAGLGFAWRSSAWATAVAEVLNTPRQLKFALSSILRAWDQLSGEVDLDELIIMTALRHGAGPAFSFALRRSFELRVLVIHEANETKEDQQRREQQTQELRNEWREAVAEARADSRALDILLCNLFPKAFAITGKDTWNQSNRVQSVNSKRGEVYLERIVSGFMPRKTVHDQDVLRELVAVSGGESLQSFADRFASSREFAELALFFDQSHTLSQPIRRQTTALLIQSLSKKAGSERLENSNVHDLFSKWESRISREAVEFVEWAAAQIIQFVPSNLLHATELWFDLVRDDYLELEKQIQIRKLVVKAVREKLSTLTPEQFARCFPSDFPYTLGHLIRLDRKDYPPEFLTKHSEWTWMAPLLLDSARVHPEILMPHLINEFGEYGPQGNVYTAYKFRKDDVTEFFGRDVAEFYALASEPFAPDPRIDTNFQRLFPLAAVEAKIYVGREENVGMPETE